MGKISLPQKGNKVISCLNRSLSIDGEGKEHSGILSEFNHAVKNGFFLQNIFTWCIKINSRLVGHSKM